MGADQNFNTFLREWAKERIAPTDDSRSAMIFSQVPERPSAAMRSSSAFFNTRARKLQNTWLVGHRSLERWLSK
jgi:hypothetical protein